MAHVSYATFILTCIYVPEILFNKILNRYRNHTNWLYVLGIMKFRRLLNVVEMCIH